MLEPDMPNGSTKPSVNRPGASVFQAIRCPECGTRLMDAPWYWGTVQVRLLKSSADGTSDELVTRCNQGRCRAWAGIYFEERAA
jgi:hypothetical protein